MKNWWKTVREDLICWLLCFLSIFCKLGFSRDKMFQMLWSTIIVGVKEQMQIRSMWSYMNFWVCPFTLEKLLLIGTVVRFRKLSLLKLFFFEIILTMIMQDFWKNWSKSTAWMSFSHTFRIYPEGQHHFQSVENLYFSSTRTCIKQERQCVKMKGSRTNVKVKLERRLCWKSAIHSLRRLLKIMKSYMIDISLWMIIGT